jgi:hypothetical protein
MDDHTLQERTPDLGRGGEARPLPADLCPLFADGGGGRTLSVPPPPGCAVWPDPTYRQHMSPRPVLWVTDEPAPPGLWADLRAEHSRSGLWPVLLDDSAQPWSAGQIAPEPVTDIDGHEAAAFMAEIWAERVAAEDDLEDLEPYGRSCPGLAPAGEPAGAPDLIADRHARGLGDSLVGLAVAARGADVLTIMGWQGAINHNQWIAPFSAVLRSWEDRFGARVIGVGFDTLELSVAAPPVTVRHALHVAAEHWAFCPDNIIQGPGTLMDYAMQIRGRTSWSFWWD